MEEKEQKKMILDLFILSEYRAQSATIYNKNVHLNNSSEKQIYCQKENK